MDDFPDIKIKVTIGSKSLEMVIPQDSSIDEYKEYFTAILTFATFHPDTIKELFYEEPDSENTVNQKG